MTDTQICENVTGLDEATQTIICVASSFSWVSIVGPIIFLFSAYVAWRSLHSARELARKKATLDLIEKVETTEYYQAARKTFSTHRRADTLHRLHDPQNDTDKADRAKIQDFLNHHEIVSIGILQEILDLSMYKSYMGGPFVRDWNASAGYIQSERWRQAEDDDEIDYVDASGAKWHYHTQIYENFQTVARKISTDAVKLEKSAENVPTNSGGLGNDPLPSQENYVQDSERSRWFGRQTSKKWL